MKPAAIYDWDGTLHNTMDAIYNTYSEVSGKPVEYIRKNLNHDWRKFVKDENIHISPENWKRLTNKYGTSLFPGAKQHLEKVRSKISKLGLATSTIILTVREDLAKYKIDRIFDAIVTADDVPNLKPDPECLKVAMKRLDVNVSDCVYIGDTHVDALAAKALGMDFIGVGWGGYETSEEISRVNNDKVACSFDELYDIVTSL